VRLVIADTSPLNYLILVGHIDLLPVLFEKLILPATVQSELASSKAPPLIRNWVANLPAWLEVRETPLDQAEDVSLTGIDAGEKAAIQLAASLNADLLLMDDRKGVNAALRRGLRVTGTLGILDLAAHRGLVGFAEAVSRLRRTTFRVPEELLDSLMKTHAPRGRTSER
jgi:predicted nucleic acid-binding protein